MGVIILVLAQAAPERICFFNLFAAARALRASLRLRRVFLFAIKGVILNLSVRDSVRQDSFQLVRVRVGAAVDAL